MVPLLVRVSQTRPRRKGQGFLVSRRRFQTEARNCHPYMTAGSALNIGLYHSITRYQIGLPTGRTRDHHRVNQPGRRQDPSQHPRVFRVSVTGPMMTGHLVTRTRGILVVTRVVIRTWTR